jgi:TP901 family phage tail tape measure protein
MNFTSSITLMFKDAFSSGFTQAQNSLAGMKGALSTLNENQSMNRLAADLAMATSLTDPFRQKLSAMMDEPSRLAGTFESSMKNIQAITGNTGSEMAALSATILDIGGKAVAGPQGAAAALNDIAGGVENAAAHIPMLQSAVILAEAGQADLGVAANGLVSVMNAYSFAVSNAATGTEQIAEISRNAAFTSDVLTQAVGMGVGSMEAFVGAMSQVSGLSASVGVGLDEVGSALAYITTKGPSASEAATQLRAAETALLNPNKALSEALKSVNIESGSAMLKQYGLVASLDIVRQAVGGSQDAMAEALGSTLALTGATSLLDDGYQNFTGSFSRALAKNVTAEAAAVQNQSYESKLARLTAATDSLQIQIGGDINAIKGFFVDMGAGFLTHVVSPIMSSPVGEVFQGIAAGVGLAAKSVLDMGSGALNTATQLVLLTATLQNAGGFAKLFKNSLGLLSSPLKGIGTGLAGIGRGALSAGRGFIGALNTATQLVLLTATLQNAGGFAKLFKSSLSLLGSPFKMIGGLALSAIGPVIAFGASLWTALAPILPIIVAVAALALGGYLLIKNWGAVSAFFVGLWNKITGVFSAAFDWIKNLLGGVSNKVLGAIAVFLPFIGIPALVIKNWGTIQAFFVGLWSRVTTLFTEVWTGIKNFFAGLWAGITAEFANAWNGILSFFNSVWNGITQIVASAANWFSGVWTAVSGAFAGAWLWIKDLFASIWESIKGVVLGFVEWLSPVIDAIIAPFKAIGNVIGGIIGAVGGWFGETVEIGKTELSKAGENKTKNYAITPDQRDAALADTNVAAALGYTTSLAVPAPAPTSVIVPPPPITTTSVIAAMPLDGATRTAQTGAGADVMGGAGKSLLNEHLAAASRKGIAGADISVAASGAFMGAGGQPFAGIDAGELEREAAVTFQAAMPAKTLTSEAPKPVSERRNEKAGDKVFNIQNVNLNTDNIHSLLDIARLIEMAVASPSEALV